MCLKSVFMQYILKSSINVFCVPCSASLVDLHHDFLLHCVRLESRARTLFLLCICSLKVWSMQYSLASWQPHCYTVAALIFVVECTIVSSFRFYDFSPFVRAPDHSVDTYSTLRSVTALGASHRAHDAPFLLRYSLLTLPPLWSVRLHPSRSPWPALRGNSMSANRYPSLHIRLIRLDENKLFCTLQRSTTNIQVVRSCAIFIIRIRCISDCMHWHTFLMMPATISLH